MAERARKLGGTLLVSRANNLHSHYKQRLEALGFRDVSVTDSEKDGLTMKINEVKPCLLLVSSNFYQCATPYMLHILAKTFSGLHIASVSLGEYPAELGMLIVQNGVRSYINYWDGASQFYGGLEKIRQGNEFVSPAVQARMEMSRELPRSACELTERQIEVLRMLCNGFTTVEIAEEIHVSRNTVGFHKKELYRNFAVRNENELIRVALFLGYIKVEELTFYGRNWERKAIPKPEEQRTKILQGDFL